MITILSSAVTTPDNLPESNRETMRDRTNRWGEAPVPAKEVLIRRMESLLERPLTPEEIRLILLAETVREELDEDDGSQTAA